MIESSVPRIPSPVVAVPKRLFTEGSGFMGRVRPAAELGEGSLVPGAWVEEGALGLAG